ncbi:hypothetical protein TL16_g10766 [Triparma laevis f. inornata]|uniref:NADP-dependent oxidoreductase domain-containing protein n=1 Tax=Triparma laevis f. inornata TaxID=1714386 RepID=A0A9W7ERJ2_9STRA|nr:hypothetical protein TL16_g10766 [Triparma laevis f. inornata]
MSLVNVLECFSTTPKPSESAASISTNPACQSCLNFFASGSIPSAVAEIGVEGIVEYVVGKKGELEEEKGNEFLEQTFYGRLYKLYCTLHLSLSLTPSSLPSTLTLLNKKINFILNPTPCPLVSFGQTGLNISTITCGSMRYQQSWNGGSVKTATLENDIETSSQKNLENCILSAYKSGINHFETARGYGTSEHQMGVAFKNLFAAGHFKREDVIIQTKVNPKPTQAEFRAEVDKSLEALQIDYIDLFSFHGLNKYNQWDLMFGEVNLYQVAVELKEEGIVRHVGFSTHGASDLISRFIDSKKFEYVNLHYHYFGSYTASGQDGGNANGECVRKARELGMGVFCISPVDKGGALYYPSDVVSKATLDEGLGMVEFGVGWALTKHDTLTIGVAREEDFDEPLFEAACKSTEKIEAVAKVLDKLLEGQDEAERTRRTIEASEARICSYAILILTQLAADAHGKEWKETCYQGLPNHFQNETGVSFTNCVHYYNLVNAFGMKFYGE